MINTVEGDMSERSIRRPRTVYNTLLTYAALRTHMQQCVKFTINVAYVALTNCIHFCRSVITNIYYMVSFDNKHISE